MLPSDKIVGMDNYGPMFEQVTRVRCGFALCMEIMALSGALSVRSQPVL